MAQDIFSRVVDFLDGFSEDTQSRLTKTAEELSGFLLVQASRASSLAARPDVSASLRAELEAWAAELEGQARELAEENQIEEGP